MLNENDQQKILDELLASQTNQAAYNDQILKAIAEIKATETPDPIIPDSPGNLGYKNFGEMLNEIRDPHTRATARDRFKAAGIQVEHGEFPIPSDFRKGLFSKGIDTLFDGHGGALVPTAFSNQLLIPGAMPQVDLRTLCFQMPMSTKAMETPSLNSYDESSGKSGGMSAPSTMAEKGTYSETSPTFDKIQLNLAKHGVMVPITEETLKFSSVSVEPIVRTLMQRNFVKMVNKHIIRGTGAGEPLGILNSPALITVTEESAQASLTIKAENIDKMWARQPNKDNAVWIVNHNCVPQLSALSRAVSTAGGQLVNMPQGGISVAPNTTIYGRPIIFTDLASSVGVIGDIILADLSSYIYAPHTDGMTVSYSDQYGFTTDQVYYKFSMYYDGQPWYKTYITPENGDTLSPFVVTETR